MNKLCFTFNLNDYRKNELSYQLNFLFSIKKISFCEEKLIILFNDSSEKNEINKFVNSYLKNEFLDKIMEKKLDFSSLPTYKFNKYFCNNINNSLLGNDFVKFKQVIYDLFKEYFDCPQISECSTFINIDKLREVNYFSGSYHHTMFAQGLKKSSDALEIFKNQKSASLDIMDEKLRVMTPAVCLHHYHDYKNKIIELEKNISFGKCYRDEGANLNTNTRLIEFNMVEFILLSNSENIKMYFDKSIILIKSLLELFKVDNYFTTSSDIFFDDSTTNKTISQLVGATKIECRFSDEKNNFSIASINKHGIHFTEPLNIKLQDSSLSQSMCFGIGLDRLFFALRSKID